MCTGELGLLQEQSRISRRGVLGLVAIPGLLVAGTLISGSTGSHPTRANGLIQSGSPEASTPVACASPVDGSPEASPVAAPVVAMTKLLTFEPAELRISVGETVTWQNESAIPHTTTADPEANPVNVSHPEYVQLPDGAEPWDSDLLQPGESFEHTFTVAGEYHYLCIPHVLGGMRGTVIVTC